MKKRITIVLAVLSALLLGVGCSSHTSYWKNYELTGYQDDPTEPEDYCTGTTYLRNAGKGGTGGGKCGKGPILGGFAAGWPRNRGGMSQLF